MGAQSRKAQKEETGNSTAVTDSGARQKIFGEFGFK